MNPVLRQSIQNRYYRGNMLLGEAIGRTDAMDAYGYLDQPKKKFTAPQNILSDAGSQLAAVS